MRAVTERSRVVVLARACSVVGGLFFVLSGLFPWFTAGAIATEPLRGRALLVASLGLVVIAAGILADRSPAAWEVVCAAAGVVGLVLVTLSTVAPPVELSPSLGVGLCAIGALAMLFAVFAARWRRDWVPPAHTSDDIDDEADESSPSVARTVLGSVGLLVALGLAYLVAWPAPTPTAESRPSPASSYDDAVGRFERVVEDERELNVFEPCTSRLFTHGETTDVAVVLFHGLTNCPQQFVAFGEQLHQAGANVVILRAPEHGIATADGDEIGGVGNVSDLSAEMLRDYADQSVDLAQGLGDEVRVLGLSMGGVIAAWTAQERDDVARVVAVAPAMTIPRVPVSLTHVFRNIFHKIPNVSLPSAGSKLDHAYAGETTKGLDATFGLAAHVADAGYGSSPAARDVIVVLNPDDDQVDPVHLSRFANAWAAHGGPVALHRLPAIGLPHDVIDVDQPDGDPGFVYPILIDLLDGVRP